MLQITSDRIPGFPSVQYYEQNSKGMWMMGEKEYTVPDADIKRILEEPDMTFVGTRVYYLFNDL